MISRNGFTFFYIDDMPEVLITFNQRIFQSDDYTFLD